MAPTTDAPREERERKREGTVGQSNASPEARLLDRLRERVEYELNMRKDRITAKLDDVAESVRRAGEPLPGTLAQYADGAAGRLHRAATDLRRRDVRQLGRELGQLARSRPVVFAGAGFAAGVLAGRFIKATPFERKPARADAGAPAERATGTRIDR